MFKFIHAADIHLDSPLRGLERYEGAPVQRIRDASRTALENLVSLAIQEKVAFVLIAGDLYDGDWREYRTGLHFVQQANKLRDAKIPLYMIAGNHDAANRMTKSLTLPENVTFFDSKAAHSVTLESVNVAIHGQSFETVAVTEDLSLEYPMAIPGSFNIGLLHTCGNGREGHERYAPCSIEGLKLKGYDYWALGHVHTRETLSEKPYIAFPGNIQGRHARETGPKGCLLVSVDDNQACQVQFQPLDVVRWEVTNVDVSEAVSLDDILAICSAAIERTYRAAEGRVLAMRLVISGRTALHDTLLAQRHSVTNEIRSIATDVGSGDVWLEKIKIETASNLVSALDPVVSDDALGEIALLFQQAMDTPSLLTDLGLDLADAFKKMPAELKDSLAIESEAWHRSILEEAQSRLLGELQGTEANP
jgi:DNA repair exonuclease SbcCD nuclease subunit